MNVIFHASAGTGKTFQVTHLYAALVLGRPFETMTPDGKTAILHEAADGPLDPRRILLMTFTDNAAAELRTRVTQLILKARHEADAAGDGAEIEKIVRILRQLPAAPISTIHSFCAGFLRERALDAGLPPGFTVLDQDDAETLLDECAQAELLARLNREPRAERSELPPYDPDFESFCNSARVLGGEYGTAVTDSVKALIHQAASLGLALDNAEDMLPPPRHTITRDDFAAVRDALHRVRASRDTELPDRARQVFQALEKCLKNFPTLGNNDEIEAFADALSENNLSFTGTGLNDISRRLRDLVEEVQGVAQYRKHHGAIRAFARYAGAVARRYAARKQELGALSFDDLLVKTSELLERRPPDPKPFDYIIVDEVQDTSRVQCRIIEELWDSRSGRLVICGDTKQSIYAWRNADPRVMPDLEKEIQATPHHRKVALRASYRSKETILDFVNALFQQVYGESYTDDERLVAAEEKNAILPKEGPCIEFLRAPWEDAEETENAEVPDLEERVKTEMEAVVRRIRLLVDGPKEWRTSYRYSDDKDRFEPAGAANRFCYSDILILLRRTSNQQVLEHLLRVEGIPYRIGGRGCGLFARQEVIDTLLFLKVTTRPFDTISLIGCLRSPWIGLSDDSILRLGWENTAFKEEVFSRMVMSPDGDRLLDGEQARRLGLARAMIAEFRAKAGYCLASEIVRELIQRTGYDAIISGTFRGTQRIANLRKLIDWVRRVERGGTVLLADVVRTLEEHTDNPPEIPEAALLDPEQNAVTIMTIHGAKGLTSRVVFVPELSSAPANDTSWALLDGQAGKAAGLYIRTEDIAREKTTTPGFEKAREEARNIREAEAKNVFYVAMTRARDLVVLSGAVGGKKPSAWRAEIDKVVAENELARQRLRQIPYGAIEKAAADLVVPPATAGRLEMEPLFDTATRIHSGTAPAARVLRFPATTLSSYHSHPEEYIKTRTAAFEPFASRARQFPGDPETSGDDALPVRDEESGGSYADFGTAGHAVLEQLALSGWRGDIAALSRASGTENGLSEQNISDLQSRIERTVSFMAETLTGTADLRVEWPFAMRLEEGEMILIVDGTMDLMVQARDGSRHIMDYKFSDEADAVLIRKYGLQLNLYRLALAHLPESAKPGIRSSLVVVGRDGVRTVDIPHDPACLSATIKAAKELDAIFKP